MGGRGGGRLFEAGRLLTFSAFRMGAYSRLGAYSNKYGNYRPSQQAKGSGFSHNDRHVDSAGRVTFFPKTTFLHKTGARRNFVNETLRHRILLLRMNAKFFFEFANTV